ncbi:MAG: adenylosuccinate lyase, partial [Nitrospirae bacterium]|nr:adenylosuccinate lyase [Nitrospirota bacterium]
MIERYTRVQMGLVWDIRVRYAKWLEVELAACEGWAELGKIPVEALKSIKEKAGFDV